MICKFAGKEVLALLGTLRKVPRSKVFALKKKTVAAGVSLHACGC